jgi:hypothetical protein
MHPCGLAADLKGDLEFVRPWILDSPRRKPSTPHHREQNDFGEGDRVGR